MSTFYPPVFPFHLAPHLSCFTHIHSCCSVTLNFVKKFLSILAKGDKKLHAIVNMGYVLSLLAIQRNL